MQEALDWRKWTKGCSFLPFIRAVLIELSWAAALALKPLSTSITRWSGAQAAHLRASMPGIATVADSEGKGAGSGLLCGPHNSGTLDCTHNFLMAFKLSIVVLVFVCSWASCFAQSESSDSSSFGDGIFGAAGIFPPELIAGSSLRKVRSPATTYVCPFFQNGSHTVHNFEHGL